MITLAFQFSASLLHPLVGWYSDRRPMPFSLALGMGRTLIGLLVLPHAANLPGLLLAAWVVLPQGQETLALFALLALLAVLILAGAGARRVAMPARARPLSLRAASRHTHDDTVL
jgi:hypothetical protein